MDSFTDPERLRQRDGVSFEKLRHVVEPDVFESVLDSGVSHVVVGAKNGRGDVLLMDSGN